MMMMTMPPEHWKTVKLGDVCEIARGGSPRPIQSYLTNDQNGINWIKISDATASNKYIFRTKDKIKPEGINSSRFVEEGDFILSNSMSFGRPYIMKTSGCIHDGWLVLKDKNSTFDQEYLYYFLSSQQAYKQFDYLASGSTVRNLNTELVKKVIIPLPPLEEQQQIVAILDEAFTAIEQAKANVARNKANAKAVFESVLNTIFNPTTQDDQQGWKTVKLGDIALKIGSGSTPRGGQESYKTEGIPLIRSLNVHDRTFKYKNLAFLDELQAKSLANVTVQEGDVLLNITGASVARCCLVVQDVVPARVNQHVSIIRVSQDKIQPEFLEYLLTSTFYKNALLGVGESGGTTRQAITKTELESFRIKFPNSLQQQRDIVDSVKQVERFTQALEAMYNKKLTAIDELKQALLHHAFTGQLTTPARHVECNETSLYHVQDDKLLQEALHP